MYPTNGEIPLYVTYKLRVKRHRLFLTLCIIFGSLVRNDCVTLYFVLFQHGANVNAMDLWQFTPIHEAASKSRFLYDHLQFCVNNILYQWKIAIMIFFHFSRFRVDVCSLLLSHGADPSVLNCHSKSAIDVCPSDDLQEKLQCMYTDFQAHSTEYNWKANFRKKLNLAL